MTVQAGKAVVGFEGDYSALLAGAASAASQAGKSFQGGLLGPVAVVAAAVVGVGIAAIDMASKYNTATDQMAANANVTIKQAQLIGSAFLATGGQTTFTAQQMMDAFAPVSGQLEMTAGHALSAGESMTFMTAAMNLAEATGQPLATVVGSLAEVMQAYGIQVSGAAGATDLLENVSRALNLPVSDLASTVDKLHAKLGPLAPSLTDVSTLLLDVASHGLTGSRALLLVSTGMNTLLGGSKATSAEVKTLGLNLYDANGQFVGMQSVIAQLAPKLAGMTEQQRLFAEKELFGSGASKALDDTLLAGLPAWDKSAVAADKVGTAHAAAVTATDNFGGAFDRLKSKVVDWLTKAGGPFQTTLTGVTNWITDTGLPDLGKLGDWFSDHRQVIIDVGAALGSLYVARKGIAVGGSVIADLERFFGSGNLIANGVKAILGIGGNATSKVVPQDVFVTNWAMIAGGKGVPGVPGVPVGAGGALAEGGIVASTIAAMGGVAGIATAVAAVLVTTAGLATLYHFFGPPSGFKPTGSGAANNQASILGDLNTKPGIDPLQNADQLRTDQRDIVQNLMAMGEDTKTAEANAKLISAAWAANKNLSIADINAIIAGTYKTSQSAAAMALASEMVTGQFGLMKQSLTAKGPQALVDIENFTHSLSLLPNHSGNLLNETANISNLMKAGKIKTAHDLGVYEDQWNYIQGHAKDADAAQGALATLIANGTITNAGQVQTFLGYWNTATTNMGGIPPTLAQIEADMASSHDKTSTLPGIFSALMRDANGAAYSASVLAADLAAAIARQGANASGYAGHTDTTAGPHAMGGFINPGMWGTAGEGRAWELLHALPGGGVQVYPNRQSTQMARGGGVTIHQTINISGTTPESLLAQMDAKIGAHNAALFNALRLAP